MKLLNNLKQKLKKIISKKDLKTTIDEYKKELISVYKLDDLLIMKPSEPIRTIGSVIIYDIVSGKIIEKFEIEKVVVFSFIENKIIPEEEYDYEEVDIYTSDHGLQELIHGVCKNSDIYNKYPLILVVGTSYVNGSETRLGNLIINTYISI